MKNFIFIFSIFITKFSSSQQNSIGIHLSEMLFNSTVKIEGIKKVNVNGKTVVTKSTGTGFYYRFIFEKDSIDCIVTNGHVIEGYDEGSMSFNSSKNDKPVYGDILTVNIKNFSSLWLKHPSEDLAILPLQPIRTKIYNQYKKFIYSVSFSESELPNDSVLNSLTAIEDILMIGYPKGFYDAANNIPILRRGVTATPIYLDYNKLHQFLIDIPIYSGSSGSPIIIYNASGFTDKTGNLLVGKSRVHLMGIASESRNYEAKGSTSSLKNGVPIETKTQLPLNIAIAIKSSALQAFKSKLQEASRDPIYSKLILRLIEN